MTGAKVLAAAICVAFIVAAAFILEAVHRRAALAATSAIQVFKDQPLSLPGGKRDAAVQFLSPEQVTVRARRSTVVDLHFRVAGGLHINSHFPSEKTLIPTRLAVVEGDGVEVTAVDFPPGIPYTPAFSPTEKLSVYTGDFVLHAHLSAQPGEHQLQGALRYQACDVNSCMPPSTIPVAIDIKAEGSGPASAHSSGARTQ